jgi:hypothetical protein
VTDRDIYGDFTESDRASIPGTMYRFLDLVNVVPSSNTTNAGCGPY